MLLEVLAVSNKKWNSKKMDEKLTSLEEMIGDMLLLFAPRKQQIRDNLKKQLEILQDDDKLDKEIDKLEEELKKYKNGEKI